MTNFFSKVEPPVWDDKPVFVVGGGPSLIPWRDHLHKLADRGYVVAVNDAYVDVKPDAIVTLDYRWFKERKKDVPSMPGPVYYVLPSGTKPEPPKVPNAIYLKRKQAKQGQVLSYDTDYLVNGLTSGHAGMQYAWLKGGKEIYLLGMDFKQGPKGEHHYHKRYTWGQTSSIRSCYPKWAERFNECRGMFKRAGVQVYNCSPDTLLKGFDYVSYGEVLS